MMWSTFLQHFLGNWNYYLFNYENLDVNTSSLWTINFLFFLCMNLTSWPFAFARVKVSRFQQNNRHWILLLYDILLWGVAVSFPVQLPVLILRTFAQFFFYYNLVGWKPILYGVEERIKGVNPSTAHRSKWNHRQDIYLIVQYLSWIWGILKKATDQRRVDWWKNNWWR